MTLYAILYGIATACGVTGGLLATVAAAYLVTQVHIPRLWWVPVVLLGVAAGLGATIAHMGAP